jgi:hypothetical protein
MYVSGENLIHGAIIKDRKGLTGLKFPLLIIIVVVKQYTVVLCSLHISWLIVDCHVITVIKS